jgi:hypothetical protein
MNAVEIEAAISDLALESFKAAEFPYAFLASFGNKDTTLKRLRTGNNNASDVPGGVLLRNNIHIAVGNAGTVGDTLKALRASLATTKAKAKFILATDGQTLEAEELVSGETIACDYADFPNHFGFFLPLAGISTIKEIKDNPIDVRATGRLNKLYVELLRENPAWATEQRRADMNHFMARLVFCFFAEDTDIFNGEGLFTQTVEQMSERDGSNVHEVLSEIFRAMNVNTRHAGMLDNRHRLTAKLRPWADQFPYVNGGLFSGSTEVPRFTRMARTYLLHAGGLNWRQINPDIFGSMIQAVADDEERGELGMHYTSVPNILKVLNPLFLDDLHAQLDAAGDNKAKLLNLRKRMARIRVFDPACGSGNFLVIAYKQMREIEAEINRRRGESHLGSEIPVNNFRGIELRNFPAEIARLALIIAEYQCDVLYRGQKDAVAEFLPLDAQNWIVCGNALRLDWLSICPPTGTGVKIVADDLFGTPLDQTEIDFENEGGETYICGNPPFTGTRKQSIDQKSDLELVFSGLTKQWKNVDYVGAWFLKAAKYSLHCEAPFAFVATNSICQGQQVPITWGLIASMGFAIRFAHTSFKWSNLASNKAGVTVVIVGADSRKSGMRSIYYGESKAAVEHVNPYLTSHRVDIVEAIRKPAFSAVALEYGVYYSKSAGLMLSPSEARGIKATGVPERYLREFIGSHEFINGDSRCCLWISDADKEDALTYPAIASRIKAVEADRLATDDKAVNKLASRSHQFREFKGDEAKKIFVPIVSSENRQYFPAGLTASNVIPTNKAFYAPSGDLWALGVILTRLHLVWIGTVCGRLEMRYSYSNTLGWNTFPIPLLTEQNKADLTACAESILLAREAHFPATIADLYDPETMPDNLRHAHERNDEVLERIYIGRRFKNDTERLEKLFELYTKMTAAAKAKPAAKAIKGKKK